MPQQQNQENAYSPEGKQSRANGQSQDEQFSSYPGRRKRNGDTHDSSSGAFICCVGGGGRGDDDGAAVILLLMVLFAVFLFPIWVLFSGIKALINSGDDTYQANAEQQTKPVQQRQLDHENGRAKQTELSTEAPGRARGTEQAKKPRYQEMGSHGRRHHQQRDFSFSYSGTPPAHTRQGNGRY